MIDRVPLDELEISENWKVGDLTNVGDCDEARVVLTRGIASIDAQLEAFDRETDLGVAVSDDDAEWQRKARAARKIKNAIIQVIQSRRGDLARQERQVAGATKDRQILGLIKARFPDAFAAAIAEYEVGVAG